MFSSLVNYFIPKAVLDDASKVRSARILVIILLITGIFNLVGISSAITISYQKSIYLLLFGSFICFVAAFLFKSGLPFKITVHLFLAISFTQIYLQAWWGGGLESPSTAALFLIPAIAMLLNERNGAIFWIVIAVFAIIFIFWYEGQYGQLSELYNTSMRRNFELNAIIGMMLCIFVIILAIDKEKNDAYSSLADKNKIIEQQAYELQQLDAAKTRFFANVSHELRTPITLMLGPLSSALKSKTLDNKNTTFVTLAQVHSQQLLRLVNEILDLTKLESGKMITHEEPTEIYEFIRRLVATFESYGVQRDIKLIYNFDKNVPHVVMLDKPKFEKIFNNLLSNALKFTPNGGIIETRITQTSAHWKLSVIDNGRGIHPDDLPHVFNRFYQTNQNDAPIEGGTGIGLALCYELSQVMGGKFSVQSKLDEGATFTLELPMREVLGFDPLESYSTISGLEYEPFNDLEKNSPQQSFPINNQLSTILIVEDNRSLLEFLSNILSDNYNVLKAENGQVALEVLKRMEDSLTSLPDLIVSDIMMPIMDGFQLLVKLKADENLQSIPVIMLTARAEMQDKLKALTIGVDDYLIKPFVEDELFARIENLLRNKEARKKAQINGETSESDESYLEGKVEDLVLKAISNEDKNWLDNVEVEVRNNISNDKFSIEDLSKLALMSERNFYRRLQNLTGLTPLKYIQEIKFNYARTLLEQQKMSSAKAVAAAIGIQKIQYFSKEFKERFGKSPSEYF